MFPLIKTSVGSCWIAQLSNGSHLATGRPLIRSTMCNVVCHNCGHGQKPIDFPRCFFQNGWLTATLDFSVSVLQKMQNPGSPNGLPIVDGWMVCLSSG